MLNAISSLTGFEIHAKDGSLGTVSDFLFDDRTWKIRWMVVDTGRWLPGKKVLIHPSAIVSAQHGTRELGVALTKAQVKDSPDIQQDQPVSRQMQSDLYGYYGWDPLWGGGMSGGGIYGGPIYGGGLGAVASPMAVPVHSGLDAALEVGADDADPHLRSTVEVTGYHVHATDGNIGHVEDLLVTIEGWDVLHLAVQTSDWWVGQHVLISPHAVKEIDLSRRQVVLGIDRAHVKSSPSWDPSNTMTGEFAKQPYINYA